MVVGCSSSEDAEVAEKTDKADIALASTLPLVTKLEKSDGQPDETDEPVTPFDEDLNFFTPPKMVIPTELDEEEIDLSGDLPPLRLVGFVGAAGDKAMVAVDGKSHIVKAGKRLNGIEIVSVASPNVGLRWGETELTLNFYKPNKTKRAAPKAAPLMTFSPGLSNFGNGQDNHNSLNSAAKAIPTPGPTTSLPPLPSLPTTGNAAGADLSVFPDLGPGLDAAPAP
ncbi:MAG: hypothetical protein CMJ50_07880 [Planctomycetaceae bacterium]|nr:hypothetical protein [Planctomycetaceae bacterium]